MASSWACSRPRDLRLAGFRAVAGSANWRATSSARASAWRSLSSTESARAGGRLGSVLLAEALHAAGGVDHLLLAGEEGVAGAAHFNVDDGGRRARDKAVPARALDGRALVFGVNSGFHYTHPCLIVGLNEVRKYSQRTNLGARLTVWFN